VEWDLAAGFYAGRNEVTNFGGQPRVLRPKPEPTHGPNSGTDINQFGLRDMAGNGREWTRMIFAGNGVREIDSTPPSPTDRIVLRGRNFTFSTGLTLENLRYEQANPFTNFASVRSPYTSFRVVVALP
jgi:hypothetical protein